MKLSFYPANIESKLGFDSVRKEIISMCSSPLGVKEAEQMAFSSDLKEIRRLLKETSEMKGLLESGSELPDVSFNDISPWLLELRVPGAYASSENLLRLKKSLESFTSVRKFYLRKRQDDGREGYIYPSLAEIFYNLEEFPSLCNAIDRCIDKFGYVKDNASVELSTIRSNLNSLNGSVSRTVQRVFANAVNAGIADKDAVPTLRDGRMVIPVPAANKRGINGIVHDESASGKTVFVEPAEVVALSNKIRELQLAEQREIVKILIEISDVVRPEIDAIISGNRLLGILDFITAKARYAIEVGGNMPSIETRPEIDWYGAVHPVLLQSLKKQGKKVVPLTLRLDSKLRFLVISGPNAGGKSVALKTAGIVQYMLQCGLLPTLYSNSHVGIFERIFIDIGDEQSLENDLSTYSSHLRNMKFFLLNANKRTLILADEIGSGTEPAIGGALAQSILAELAKTGCFGIVTTHYYNLKQFAEETEGFINGAMLYDRQKLQPLFQLSVGNAGSSFALEIAGKIGLPKFVIENAKELVGSDYVNSDRYLMDIARDRRYWHNKRLNIKEKEAKVEDLLEKYDRMASELRQKRNEIIQEAKKEAKEILASTNARIENTIFGIREAQAEKDKTRKLRQELDSFKKSIEEDKVEETKLDKIIKPLKKQKKKKEKTAPAAPAVKIDSQKPLGVGDYVQMAGHLTPGKILSIEGKKAEVAFGNLRTMVKLDSLKRTSEPKGSSASTVNVINKFASEASRQRQLNFKGEIDVRGFRADEALEEVTRFIDDSIQFGVGKVRILHGTGHGILRTLIRQQLACTPGVESFSDEDVRLGGAGITVVSLA